MIELYAAPTPNSQKICVMLEEVQLPYRINKVDLSKGEHYRPEYLKINPNAKCPAIIDTDNSATIFESGAILLYLAEKSGKLLPTSLVGRAEVYQWLMFEMSALGPTGAQFMHYLHFAPDQIPYAVDRYKQEALRLLDVLNKHLAERAYLCGDYSIADIAALPLVKGFEFIGASQGIVLANFPNVERWAGQLFGRPTVQRGMGILFMPEAATV